MIINSLERSTKFRLNCTILYILSSQFMSDSVRLTSQCSSYIILALCLLILHSSVRHCYISLADRLALFQKCRNAVNRIILYINLIPTHNNDPLSEWPQYLKERKWLKMQQISFKH